MASTLTQIPEFYVDTTTTTPVLLSESRPGIDYILRRGHTTGTNCTIGKFVNPETDDLYEWDVAGANGVALGIIPDTAFNRRQISIHNTTAAVADWSYSLVFADETEIEIMIPINNLVVRATMAASNAITPRSGIAAAAAGVTALSTTSDVIIGRPANCIIASGTGVQVYALIWYAAQATHAPA